MKHLFPRRGISFLEQVSHRPRPARAQRDATRLEEHGEREMRAVRLLREGCAQIPYLIAHSREVLSPLGSASVGHFQSPGLPGLSQPISCICDGIAPARRVNLLSALSQRFAT